MGQGETASIVSDEVIIHGARSQLSTASRGFMNAYVRRTPGVDWLTWLNINSGAVMALISAAVVVGIAV